MIEYLTNAILEALTGEDYNNLYPRMFESTYRFSKRLSEYKKREFEKAVWKLQKRGAVEVYEKNNKKFIKCTKKGQLEVLLKKAKLSSRSKWDGKYRLIIYDFPEKSHSKRDQFRLILKQNGYKKLQDSVFISPYPLNREAVRYLKESGLDRYIRIMRIDEIDDSKDVQKRFNIR